MLLAAISFCLVSVFFVFQACFSAKDNAKANVPEISETVIEEKIKEEDSFFKNFLACCSLLSKENGKLRFYSETKDNFIEFKVLCSSPSKLLESLQKENFQFNEKDFNFIGMNADKGISGKSSIRRP